MTYQIQYFVRYVDQSLSTLTISNVGVWEGAKAVMTSETLWHYAESATSIMEIKSNS